MTVLEFSQMTITLCKNVELCSNWCISYVRYETCNKC